MARLDDAAAAYRAEAVAARSEVGAIEARIGRPFEHQGRLISLRARLFEVSEALVPSEVTDTAVGAGVAVPTAAPGTVGLPGPRTASAPVLPTAHQRHELHTAMYGPTETPPVIQA